MSDDQENISAGSETSGETAADTTATEQSDVAATDATDTSATDTAQADQEAGAQDAGGAADETKVPVEGSRTGFVDKGQAGGECICPDGRKGTIHTFDAGLVCIPNENQSA